MTNKGCCVVQFNPPPFHDKTDTPGTKIPLFYNINTVVLKYWLVRIES